MEQWTAAETNGLSDSTETDCQKLALQIKEVRRETLQSDCSQYEHEVGNSRQSILWRAE
jgi:hypothetical protein